jgi:site-specific DNA-methyltransferase (adenine-specific)
VKPYYQDEQVKIYHGDCFDLLHEFSGVGAVVTDPPYSSGGMFRSDRNKSTVEKYVNSDTETHRPEFSGDNRDQRSFVTWCAMWMNAARRACVPGAPILSFSDWRQVPSMSDALQAGGWIWLNMGTWWKPGVRMQRGRFSSSAEYVLYGANGPVLEGVSSPQNVFSCGPVLDKEHIAQKPVSVLKWAMGVLPAGSLVLDPFCGSGATLEAAKQLGLKAIGIDVDEGSCEISARRQSQGVLL